MSKEYIAFISYNHNERDIKVAKVLQSLLEHTTIPKSSRINNKRKLGKIFRDESELHCGDLSEQIKNALNKSEYLIILCSQEYNNSDYCKKELYYFCDECSDKNHVQVIVSDGNPNNIEKMIPRRLWNNNEPPLAAEIIASSLKGNIKKLRKYEYAKIMGGILNINSDSFINRLKVNKRRIISLYIIITIAFLSLIAYSLYENVLPHHEMQVRIFNNGAPKWVTGNNVNVSKNSFAVQSKYKNIDYNENTIIKITLPNGVNPDYQSNPTVSLIDENNEQHYVSDERIFTTGLNIAKYIDTGNFTCRFFVSSKQNNLSNRIVKTSLSDNITDEILLNIYNDHETICGWGDNIGGRQSYTIDEINKGALKNQIVFNSISDSTIGDEKNFVNARIESNEDNGIDSKWAGNEIFAENNKIYLIRLYVHNNGGITANNVNVRFNVPTNSDYSIPVHGGITATNAYPNEYWDGILFSADKKFHLEYIPGTAGLANNGIGAKGGNTLSDSIIHEYIPIGYEALDGNISPGYQYASYISIKVKAIYDE